MHARLHILYLAGGVVPVHESFSIIALATPTGGVSKGWLSNDVLQLFHFFTLQTADSDAMNIVSTAVPTCPSFIIEKLAMVRAALTSAAADAASPLYRPNTHDDGSEAPTSLSLRQMLRAARRAAASLHNSTQHQPLPAIIGEFLEAALMTEFMPRAERAAVCVCMYDVVTLDACLAGAVHPA